MTNCLPWSQASSTRTTCAPPSLTSIRSGVSSSRRNARALALLLEEITYHAGDEEVELRFWPGGVRQLAGERSAEA